MTISKDNAKPKRSWSFKWSRNATIISLVIHGALICATMSIVAIKAYIKPIPDLVATTKKPSLRRPQLNMRVSPQQLQKSSARPTMKPRMAALAPSNIPMPKRMALPKDTRMRLSRDLSELNRDGFGKFGDYGVGIGGGIGSFTSFFGVKATGKHIVFIVDRSGTADRFREEILEELQKSVNALQLGTSIQVIFFSGSAWFAGDNPVETSKDWEKVEGQYVRAKGFPSGRWVALNLATKSALLEKVSGEKVRPSESTDWKPAFQIAMAMNPKPDVIYFLTDGKRDCAKIDEFYPWLASANQAGGKKSIVNALVIGQLDPKMEGELKEMSQSAGGTFKYVPVEELRQAGAGGAK